MLEQIRVQLPSSSEARRCIASIEEETNRYTIAASAKKSISTTNTYIIHGRKPIIRPITNNELFATMRRADNEILQTCFKNFLMDPTDEYISIMKKELQKKIQNINLTIHSEYLLASIIIGIVIEIGIATK